MIADIGIEDTNDRLEAFEKKLNSYGRYIMSEAYQEKHKSWSQTVIELVSATKPTPDMAAITSISVQGAGDVVHEFAIHQRVRKPTVG